VRLAAFATLCAVAASVGACGDDSDGDLSPSERGAGGDALGSSASTKTLARMRVAERPPGELAWVADEVLLGPGESIEHRHELGFAYAREGPQVVRSGGGEIRLREGEAAPLVAEVGHRHLAEGGGSRFWEIRLARPGAPAPPGAETARRVVESEPLEGIPEPAEASFIEVTVPPRGGRTTVHTHPGPEFIYELSGRIDYQNAIIGTKRLGPGDAEGIPPGTPVQKRNPFALPARFLSLFLVDPERPFAPRASF
jgi:quercetin dioxygenase-like cupin family protein